MTPFSFPEANTWFRAPNGVDESQCATIAGLATKAAGGSMDGAHINVVAWQPDEAEREAIKNGAPIFLTFVGGVPPHFPSMSVDSAVTIL